jgi:hypothetical protein
VPGLEDGVERLAPAAQHVIGWVLGNSGLSGHGASSPDESCEDVALLLAKWSHCLARLALSTDEYRGALGGMGLFEEIVVTLDCCRTATVRAVGLPPMFPIGPVSENIAYYTSEWRQESEDLVRQLEAEAFAAKELVKVNTDLQKIAKERTKILDELTDIQADATTDQNRGP